MQGAVNVADRPRLVLRPKECTADFAAIDGRLVRVARMEENDGPFFVG